MLSTSCCTSLAVASSAPEYFHLKETNMNRRATSQPTGSRRYATRAHMSLVSSASHMWLLSGTHSAEQRTYNTGRMDGSCRQQLQTAYLDVRLQRGRRRPHVWFRTPLSRLLLRFRCVLVNVRGRRPLRERCDVIPKYSRSAAGSLDLAIWASS